MISNTQACWFGAVFAENRYYFMPITHTQVQVFRRLQIPTFYGTFGQAIEAESTISGEFPAIPFSDRAFSFETHLLAESN